MVRLNAYARMGITPAELASRYRSYAANCVALSQSHDDAGEKLLLLDMAQAWMALAEQAERNETRFVVPETPVKLN